jgi:hypothetical protein
MAAKRPDVGALKNARKLTEPTEPLSQATGRDVSATGRTIPVGVGLKESEVRELDVIASENDIARNALLRIAVHRFLDDYRTGRVDLAQYHKVTTTKRLNF